MRVASLLHIAGTQLSVVQKLAERKDYLDIELFCRKALSFFGDLPSLPKDSRTRIVEAVKNVVLTKLPSPPPYQEVVDLNDYREALENSPAGIFDPRSWAYWNLIRGREPCPPLPFRKFEISHSADVRS